MKPESAKQEDALYWQYARDSVSPVLRMIVIFGIIAQTVFMLEDWYATPDQFFQLLTIKLIATAVLIGAYFLSVTERGKAWSNVSMLIVSIGLMINVSIQASLLGVAFMVPLVAILVTFISASLFPWKLRYHIIITVAAVIAVIQNTMTLVDPPYLPLSREAMAGVVFPATSILLAVFAHRRRIALWRAERTLKESEERFRQLAEHSSDIIWIWSPDGQVQYVSPAYTQYTGRNPESLYKDPGKALEIVREDDRESFALALAEIMRGKPRKMDLHVNHTDGSTFFLEGWGAPIRDDSGEVIRCVGIWRDVTERVRLIKDLDVMATTDDLTKVHNRRFFFDAAEKEVGRAARNKAPLSLVLFDIDKFKKINDKHGHETGDRVLVEISDVCRKILRAGDVFARIGGEEFVMLLPDTGSNEAALIAERIRKLISQHSLEHTGKSLSVTVSIGVTSWSTGKNPDTNALLNEADQAMYRSKSNGRNKVTIFAPNFAS